jgi:tRNA modification GTPase
MYVLDGSELPHPDDLTTLRSLDPVRTLLVINKMDHSRRLVWGGAPPAREVEVCLKDGRGLQTLREAISELLGAGDVGRGAGATISERHRKLLQAALDRLREALALLQSTQGDAPMLAAAQVRLALEEIGRTTGRVYEEELLNSIFSRFCIGK